MNKAFFSLAVATMMIVATTLFAVILTSCNDKNEDEFIEFECTYEVDNFSKELLVFIVRDYFELIIEQNEKSCVQICKIKSKQLKVALETLNIVSIAKAFPDWPEEIVIVYNEYGHPVQKPEFDRVFKILFVSEQEADEAIEKLNALPEVLYAEKNGSASPNFSE